ncbi:hypothetical protein M436DRAFT_67751 [Aureobasidium namibiae CBS 147.97]|uniref:Uncharacterized protein n=1 Tax=Aureobasidium namibiae CBS 147.97 TaxID=1043004 RepID=A0A074WG31_9PEZI
MSFEEHTVMKSLERNTNCRQKETRCETGHNLQWERGGTAIDSPFPLSYHHLAAAHHTHNLPLESKTLYRSQIKRISTSHCRADREDSTNQTSPAHLGFRKLVIESLSSQKSRMLVIPGTSEVSKWVCSPMACDRVSD